MSPSLKPPGGSPSPTSAPSLPWRAEVEDVDAWVREMNELRDAARGTLAEEAIESLLERLFGAGRRLAVYGSLAPGEEHADELEGLEGTWSRAFVRGELQDGGWAAGIGYPALRLDPTADPVGVQVFESPDLPGAWARLDEFEGDGYRRSLVPLYDAEGELVGVANLYEEA